MSEQASTGSLALRVDRVEHVFRRPGGGTYQAIANVSFDVRRGEFLAIMGPSGSGKSTLLGLIAGFSRPTGGHIQQHGKQITSPDRSRGMVFQKPALYPWMSVQENVEFGPLASGCRREIASDRANRLIREVGLAGFEQYRPYELSGGMQHRVALARTLANEPEILLMDEPFAALDAQIRGEMQGLLLQIWERHRSTVVFVTHDIEEGLLLADRAIIFSRAPATVRNVIQVSIARPRNPETVLEPDFIDMRRKVRVLLQHDQDQ